MELPMYVWRPRSNIQRRQGRPLSEILREWAAWVTGGARQEVPASLAARQET